MTTDPTQQQEGKSSVDRTETAREYQTNEKILAVIATVDKKEFFVALGECPECGGHFSVERPSAVIAVKGVGLQTQEADHEREKTEIQRIECNAPQEDGEKGCGAWFRLVPTRVDELPDAFRDQQWNEFVSLSTDAVAKSNVAWKEGLAGLLSLATTSFVLISRPDASSYDETERWVVLVLALAATGFAVASVAVTLVATAGIAEEFTRSSFEQKYRTVQEFNIKRSCRAARSLCWARIWVAVSIVASLGLAGYSWMMYPSETPSLRVGVGEKGVMCGSVLAAEKGEIHLKVAGKIDPVVIEAKNVTSLSPVKKC